MKPTSPLRQLRRRKPLRSLKRSSYAQRPRDLDYMADVRRLGCIVRRFWPVAGEKPTPCYGHVEADHMGMRALGRKADDTTCVAMCQQHHRERTDHSGSFKTLDRNARRVYAVEAIERTQREVQELRDWRAA